MCMGKQQAAGSQSDLFLVTMRLCLCLVAIAIGTMKHEPYQLYIVLKWQV